MPSAPSLTPTHPAAAPLAGTAVLYVNLGTPEAPTAPAVRRYLAEFLSDPRVVEIPRLAWLPILHGIILRVRPAKSAAKYATVWTPEGSPLKVWTERQARGMQAALVRQGLAVPVLPAMRYGEPALLARLDALQSQGVRRILVVPAYPQYSGTTTASVSDLVYQWAQRQRAVPEVRLVRSYHDDEAYIEAVADGVRHHWATHGQPDVLLMSFHGLPARNVQLGDPYQAECLATARLLAARLGLAEDRWRVTFQSRFGRARWLEPYTEPTAIALAQSGVKHLQVVCPGFTGDCIETLEEIDQEVRAAYLQAGGGTFSYIPCINDSELAIAALAGVARRQLQGWG
ncbi:MAG: Ferrochelatase [Paracidovorax wautersii]|uniref:Ferrochelatase n=1 Tax=Paracidovorax wautersii TaxID=1177982 RepID=A0A7V8FKN3_9BURK|nr:MAG: Ferrochelatase [Paracidovorax wautersii]